MPQAEPKIKRIVSTNFFYTDNPLQSARINGVQATPPFLISSGGVSHPVNATNFVGEWDVMILGDGANSGLGDIGQLTEPVEVLWLYHRGETWNQWENLKKCFGSIVKFQPISFQHTPGLGGGYDRYLNKVAALWESCGEYDAKLAELDCVLRSEQVESDIVDFLWLLAVKISDSNGDEQINELYKKKRKVVKEWAEASGLTLGILLDAVSNSTDKRDAYTKLKNALKNSLAERDPVREVSPA